MSLWLRLMRLLHVGEERAATTPREPVATLEQAYARQLELQEKMRRGVAEVVASRQRIELQVRQLDAKSRDLTDLKALAGSLAAEETRLRDASARLDRQIDQLRTRTEALRSTLAAGRATAGVSESFTGYGAGDYELFMALRRAQDTLAFTRARAEAMDRLTGPDMLESPDLTPPDGLGIQEEEGFA